MPTVIMPDGQAVEMPDNPSAEQLRMIADVFKKGQRETIAGVMMKGGRQILRGAGDAAVNVLDRGLLGIDQPPEPNAKNLMGGQPLGAMLREVLDKNIPAEPGLGNAALRGAGAGVPNPKMMVSGAAGGTAAEAVKDFGPLAQLGAGGLAGGMTAYAMGPRAATTPEQNVARDTGTLTNLALDRVGPKTSPQTAANMAESAADSYFKEARQNRGDMFSSTLAGNKVSKLDLANIYSATRRAAQGIAATGRGEQADAMMEAANRLVTGDGRTFISDLQELSLSLKRLKENPAPLSSSTGKAISSKEIASSIKALESALEAVSPEFKRANSTFAYNSRMIDTAAEGPMGRIADKQPFNADPAPLGKVNAVIGGSDPSQITQTMAALKASGADPAAIARALIQKKVETGGMNPSQRVFGGPGSSVEEQIATLITSGGRDPAAVKAPLDIADRMAQNLKGGDSVRDFATVGPHGVAARALVKPNALSRMAEGETIRRDLTKLLQNASPQEVEQLMKLSMFDPKLRLALTMSGFKTGAVAGENQ